MPKDKVLEEIRADWMRTWPSALSLWGKFTRLSEPRWCSAPAEESREGLSGSFAMIRFPDHAIVISLSQIREHGLEDYPLEILSHEIGHHVLCPSDLADQGRMLARIRKSLPTKENSAPFVANLYADLLINDRLQRHGSLRISDIYRRINQPGADELWTFYMRIYELLWKLSPRTLATGKVDKVMEADAQLGARLIRSYARNWLDGSGRFAALCLPYMLKKDEKAYMNNFAPLLDGINPAAGSQAQAHGLTEIESDEWGGALHPSIDPLLSGADERAGLGDDVETNPAEDGESSDTDAKKLKANEDDGRVKPRAAPTGGNGSNGAAGQYREPFEYGEILKSLGLKLTDEEAAIRYYRERAMPHLVPFPTVILPESTDPQPEGLEPWDVGAPLEDIDWFQSVLLSPHIIPGMTTVQRTRGTCEGHEPDKRPMDLDLYVDCSGSMPDPRNNVSYLALAGAIVALSALRAGARVQATLWSGPQQFQTTNGFVSDENAILGVVAGYIGGSTAFPIHLLRDTHLRRTPRDRAAHILVISDNGCDTMFCTDEEDHDGVEISRMALENARGGGTLVLNLFEEWQENPFCVRAHSLGFDVYRVQNWEQLEQFAKAFSSKKYGQAEEELLRARKRVP